MSSAPMASVVPLLGPRLLLKASPRCSTKPSVTFLVRFPTISSAVGVSRELVAGRKAAVEVSILSVEVPILSEDAVVFSERFDGWATSANVCNAAMVELVTYCVALVAISCSKPELLVFSRLDSVEPVNRVEGVGLVTISSNTL